ncbi:MAG: MATE family efflux transporter [Sphaerochaeta sp.]|jgi:putative MATE family efflux protein|nr:MATE family efflux transporter [Sphaerochaeta sp.]HAP57319.1 MATE family efflux transporter [Sphaerochaeta sp.]
MEHDMSSGKPARLLFFFMLPILGGNLFQQLYSMVDTFVVGRYVGVEALAAVGATGSMTFLILGFVVGLTAGFSVIISQKFGAKDPQSMRKAVAMSVLSACFLSLIVSTLAILTTRPLLQILRTPENIIDDSYAYLIIIYIGIVATIYYNLFAAILRALGDSRSPLYFLLIASALNIAGDLAAVIGLGMGVRGVAAATVLSQTISALLCLLYIYKKYPSLHLTSQDWKIDWPMISRLLRIGLPSALQFSVCAIGVMIVQSVINESGSDTVAAYSVGVRIEQLVTQPLVTLGLAMATFSAQNLGSGRLDRVQQGIRSALLLCILFSVLAWGLVFLFGKQLALLFIEPSEQQVVAQTVQYLHIISYFFIPLGLIFVFRNTCQGLGSGLIPMLSSIQELLFRALVAVTLPPVLGYVGICLSSPIAWIAAALLLVVAYKLQYSRLSRLLKQ